jgi:hypothetical protein
VPDVASISGLYRRIAAVTTRFEFTEPVEISDMHTVRAELEHAVPELSWGLLQQARGVEVTGYWEQNRPAYRRLMLVASAPHRL